MTRFYHSSKTAQRSIRNPNKLFPAILAGTLFLITSCEKEGTMIGKNILPGKDFISLYSTDTLSVYSYTMYSGLLESDNPGTVFLGTVRDPYFGTTTAGFVTQLRMFTQWDGGIYTVDSVKLSLTLASVSGDAAAGHILRISEISEQIYTDSAYYSSRTVPLTGYTVEATLPQMKADTINNVILDLPVSFGEYIIRNTSMLFHSDDKPDFRSYLKGLFFQLQSAGNPVFITLSLKPPGDYEYYKHQLSIYMHDENGTSNMFVLNIDAKAKNAAYSTFSHDFSTADYNKKITHVNDGVRDTLSYIQSLNGLFTRLTIPGLEDIKKNPELKGIYINKARITCPVHFDGTNYKGSTFPSQLFMGYYDKSGKRYLIPDYSISAAFFNGRIDTASRNYTFNIASYVQRFLNDTTGNFMPEFQLALPEGSLRNAILKANNSATPINFELVYTRF